MKLILILVVVFSLSCSGERNDPFVTKPIPVKPFIIIDKYYQFSSRDICGYTYIDATGKQFDFSDESILYHVGDTLK